MQKSGYSSHQLNPILSLCDYRLHVGNWRAFLEHAAGVNQFNYEFRAGEDGYIVLLLAVPLQVASFAKVVFFISSALHYFPVAQALHKKKLFCLKAALAIKMYHTADFRR